MAKKDDKLKRRAIELLRDPSTGGYFSIVAGMLGIDRRTLFRWRQEDRQFNADCKEARLFTTEKVEAKLYNLAMEGDIRAAALLLRARKPTKYGTREPKVEPEPPLAAPGECFITKMRERVAAITPKGEASSKH